MKNTDHGGARGRPTKAEKLIADALGVSTDHLLNDNQVAIKDTELLKKFEVIQELNGDTKKLVDNFLDMIIRDHKTKIAYTK